MAQNFTDNVFQPDHVGQTDLQNMENNFNVLRTSFSGQNAPSNQTEGNIWLKTVSNQGLRMRNSDNTEWLKILTGDADDKIWIYRNDTSEGWIIDATVTDRVLALKGGSQAYNITGGTTGGTWTQPGHSLTVAELASHTHSGTTNSVNNNHRHNIPDFFSTSGETGGSEGLIDGEHLFNPTNRFTDNQDANHQHTFTTGNTGSGNSHNHGTTYRPAAAVGTLQYPDLG